MLISLAGIESEAREQLEHYGGGEGAEHCADCGGQRPRRSAHWAEDRPIFEYFFRLKSSYSQDESTTFPGHFQVHWLIAGRLKLQSDCHPIVGNLDRA